MTAEFPTDLADRDPRAQLTTQGQGVKFPPMAAAALRHDDRREIYGSDRLRFGDFNWG
jgi:hypothetical protein